MGQMRNVALGGCLLGAVAARAADLPLAVRLQDLCVTEGAVDAQGNRLAVDSAKMRAYLNVSTEQMVEARFTYLGATAAEARLGSGELRRQFGLKLRAQDACNLIYAMWRLQPDSHLVVSVKRNPGQHASAQCGNRGYHNLEPERSAPLPRLRTGEHHAFRAELRGPRMQVFIDGVPVWEGDLGPAAAGLAGPVGLRSDNARLQIELRAGARLAPADDAPPPTCHAPALVPRE